MKVVQRIGTSVERQRKETINLPRTIARYLERERAIDFLTPFAVITFLGNTRLCYPLSLPQ